MLVLTGRIPSKKNSKMMVCWNGKPRLLSSQAYKVWHEEASWELKNQKPKKIKGECKIEIEITAPDKRRADLSNKAESILDLLVDNRIIEDDNWFIVKELNLKLTEIGDAKAIIKITQLK